MTESHDEMAWASALTDLGHPASRLAGTTERTHLPHFARCHRRLTYRCKVTRPGVLYQSRPGGRSGYGTTKWESARRSRAQMALLAHGAPGEEGFTIRLGCGWLSPLRGLGRPISRGS